MKTFRLVTLLLVLYALVWGVVLLLLQVVAWGAGNQSINTVPSTSTPSSSATFSTDLTNYLTREDAARQAELFPTGYVLPTTGLHGTSGNMVSPAFATTGYTTSGNRVQQGSATINYGTLGCGGTATAWVILSASATSPLGGFVRSGSSSYFVNCQSATPPTLPADSVMLMQVTLASSQITAVADLRPLSPLVAASTSRVLNVTEAPYRAPRDGNGDAAPGMNAALVDAGTLGYAVFLPCGTYRILSTIALQANVALFGGGRECTTIAPPTTATVSPVLLASGVAQLSVRHLTVDCQDATMARHGIVGRNAVSYMTVEATRVRRCGTSALRVDDTGTAPYSSGGQGIVWRGNLLEMTGVPGGACAGTTAAHYRPQGPINFLASPGPIIEGNTILAGAVERGIVVDHALGGRITNNAILDGPTCVSATGAAIVATTTQDAQILGNTMAAARTGVLFGALPILNAAGGNQVPATGTLVKNNTVTGWVVAGMLATNGTVDTTIEGNLLRGAGGGEGLSIVTPLVGDTGAQAFLRLHLVDNTVLNALTSISLVTGADGLVGYSGLRVRANTLTTTGLGYGIIARGVSGARLANNVITGHGVGIDLRPLTGSTLLDLEVAQNTIVDINSGNGGTQSCLQLLSAISPQVTGNICRNSSGSFHSKYGIILDTTTTPRLVNNAFNGMDVGDILLLNAPAQATPTPTVQQYYVDTNLTTAPANTSENIVATVTLPRNFFTTIAGVSVSAFGEFSGTGGNKTLRLYFGGSLVGRSLTFGGFATPGGYRFDAEVTIPESPPTTQHIWLMAFPAFVGSAGSVQITEFSSLSVDTTAAPVEIKVTCQKVSAGDGCNSRGLIVKPWR